MIIAMKGTLHAAQSSLGEQLAEHMYTKDEFLRTLELLKEFIASHLFTVHKHHDEGRISTQLKEFFASRKAGGYDIERSVREEGWMRSLGEDFFAQFTPQNASKFFSEAEDYLQGVPLVTVSLARAIPEKQQEEIGKWIKKNVGPTVLYEIRIVPDLLGACTLSYKGLSKDYSLQSRLASQRKSIAAQLSTAMRAK